jgi:hypothetical protein
MRVESVLRFMRTVPPIAIRAGMNVIPTICAIRTFALSATMTSIVTIGQWKTAKARTKKVVDAGSVSW